jgi:hypothetical protein
MHTFSGGLLFYKKNVLLNSQLMKLQVNIEMLMSSGTITAKCVINLL